MRVSKEITNAVNKEFCIYSSYISKCKGYITITYAQRIGVNAMTTKRKKTFRNNGGLYKTLALEIGLNVEIVY